MTEQAGGSAISSRACELFRSFCRGILPVIGATMYRRRARVLPISEVNRPVSHCQMQSAIMAESATWLGLLYRLKRLSYNYLWKRTRKGPDSAFLLAVAYGTAHSQPIARLDCGYKNLLKGILH